MSSSTRVLIAAKPSDFKAVAPSYPARVLMMAGHLRGGKTLQEVGEIFGITRERVRQLVRPLVDELPERELLCGVCEAPADQTIRPPLCSVHHYRLKAHGDPFYEPPTDEEKFWQIADRRGEDECWPWPDEHCHDISGYGRCWWGKFRELAYAHRVSWVIANGPIPDDKPHILHTCHNPPCVNPAHLYAGTPQDNVRDRQERGVWHKAMARRGPTGPISEETVRAIRAAYDEARVAPSGSGPNGRKVVPNGTLARIATRFNIPRRSVYEIGRRRRYTWVE